MTHENHSIWDAFEAVYLINLPDRKDRRRRLETQLASVGLRSGNPKLCWVEGIRPFEKGPFESIGARGCFLSHLACFESACERKLTRILILEDDACFPTIAHEQLSSDLSKLKINSWGIWYGGHRVFDSSAPSVTLQSPYQIPSETRIDTAHCVAFNGAAIECIRDFLRLILTRPPGHHEAGPMHVDGAYTTWRRLNPKVITLISMPAICNQHASRSDIGATRWFDKTPGFREAVTLLRNLRRTPSSKSN